VPPRPMPEQTAERRTPPAAERGRDRGAAAPVPPPVPPIRIISAPLPAELHARLEAVAAGRGLSINAAVLDAVTHYVARFGDGN
jgi:hypothetical protein